MKQIDPMQYFIIILVFAVFGLSIREAIRQRMGHYSRPKQQQNNNNHGKDNRGVLVRFWAFLFRGAHVPKPPKPQMPKQEKKQDKKEQIKKLLGPGKTTLLAAAAKTWDVTRLEQTDGVELVVLMPKVRGVPAYYLDSNDKLQVYTPFANLTTETEDDPFN